VFSKDILKGESAVLKLALIVNTVVQYSMYFRSEFVLPYVFSGENTAVFTAYILLATLILNSWYYNPVVIITLVIVSKLPRTDHQNCWRHCTSLGIVWNTDRACEVLVATCCLNVRPESNQIPNHLTTSLGCIISPCDNLSLEVGSLSLLSHREMHEFCLR
jgi:hypothetical protein